MRPDEFSRRAFVIHPSFRRLAKRFKSSEFTKPLIARSNQRPRQVLKLILIALLFLLFIAPRSESADVLTGDIGAHDPSRMTKCDGVYYVYSTGGGMRFSKDRLHWTTGPSPFVGGAPDWAKTLIPNNEGIWAPDVLFFNGQYHLYYSVANAKSDTCIGMRFSPTLDPKSPDYKWTDQGLIVSSHKTDERGTIDPCPVFDADGNLWLCFGSNYSSPASNQAIFIMQLDAKTGLAQSTTPALTPLQAGHIEASYIFYHDGFYYLFWNSGGCCQGVKSTYTIHIARSKKITGPYENKAANPGKDIFLASYTDPAVGEVHGPGQIGILTEDGVDRFTYHYYNSKGRPVLGEDTLKYDADGWPEPASEPVAGR
jgi:beta-xylosidase